MKLLIRRIIYLSFFIIFFTITPILIFYTAGYRFNFYKYRLEKTGVLSLDSRPQKAKIYLEGKAQKPATPAQFSNLLPGEYIISVEKSGFYPWTKKLWIESNQTTFARDIILFKQSLPILIIEKKISDAILSPDLAQIVYAAAKNNQTEIKLLNLKNGNEETLLELPTTSAEIDLLEWQKNDQLLINSKKNKLNDYLIINPEKKSKIKLSDISKVNFQKVKWDSQNGNLLYGLENEILYQINLSEELTTKILSDYFNDFWVVGNSVYYISQTDSNSYLNETKLGGENKKIKLVPGSQYFFKNSTNQNLIIWDSKNQDLLVVSPEIFKNPESFQNYVLLQTKAKEIGWLGDQKNIFYFNDFELWTYNFDNQKSELITRYSQPILGAFWPLGEKYLIYQIDNSLNAIELDGRNGRNNYQLVSRGVIKLIGEDEKNQKIYFLGKYGEREGIYELEVK